MKQSLRGERESYLLLTNETLSYDDATERRHHHHLPLLLTLLNDLRTHTLYSTLLHILMSSYSPQADPVRSESESMSRRRRGPLPQQQPSSSTDGLPEDQRGVI